MRKEEEGGGGGNEEGEKDLSVSVMCILKSCMIINASQNSTVKCDQQPEAVVTKVFNAILTCT